MLKEEEYYQALALDYLAGELDEEGAQALWQWLQAEDHVLLFRQWMKHYHAARAVGQWPSLDEQLAWESVMVRLEHDNPRTVKISSRQRLLSWTACAAGVALIVSLGWFSIGNFRPETAKPSEKYASQTHSVEHNKAILVIDETESWILSGKDSLNIPSGTGQTIHISNNGLIDYSELIREKNDKNVRQHTLKIPWGSEFCLTLSDGTRVWLNAMSEMKYPEYFTGSRREVILSGEAYFEVARDPEMPFIVRTSDMDLEVLGTSFNIRAYSEESRLTTTLASGKIRQFYPATGDLLVLAPNEQAVYDKRQQQLQVRNVDFASVVAWKEGRILFRDGTLEEIFQELNRWYDFTVSYQNEELKKMRFYLHIDRYADVETILEKLQRTRGIRFVIQGKEIMVCNDVN